MVTIGTGVGTALLNDGVLVPNTEFGHIFVNRHLADTWVSDARECADDSRGSGGRAASTATSRSSTDPVARSSS